MDHVRRLVNMLTKGLHAMSSGIGSEGSDIVPMRSDVAGGQYAIV